VKRRAHTGVCQPDDLYLLVAQVYAKRSTTITRQQCAQLFDDLYNMTGTGNQHRAMSRNVYRDFLDYVQSVNDASSPSAAGGKRQDAGAELDDHCTSPVSVADFPVAPIVQPPAPRVRRSILNLNIAPLLISRRATKPSVPEVEEESYDLDLLVRFCRLRRGQMWPLHTIQNQLRTRFIGPAYWEGTKTRISLQDLRCRASMEETDLFVMLEDSMDPRKARTSPRSSPLNRIFSRFGAAARARIK